MNENLKSIGSHLLKVINGLHKLFDNKVNESSNNMEVLTKEQLKEYCKKTEEILYGLTGVTVLELNDDGNVICPSCNTNSYYTGFECCDFDGEPLIPVPGDQWEGLYQCVKCKKIYYIVC